MEQCSLCLACLCLSGVPFIVIHVNMSLEGQIVIWSPCKDGHMRIRWSTYITTFHWLPFPDRKPWNLYTTSACGLVLHVVGSCHIDVGCRLCNRNPPLCKVLRSCTVVATPRARSLCSRGRNSQWPRCLLSLHWIRVHRFEGYRQQDSHELLRHLLDEMKTEEIKVRRSLLLWWWAVVKQWCVLYC